MCWYHWWYIACVIAFILIGSAYSMRERIAKWWAATIFAAMSKRMNRRKK